MTGESSLDRLNGAKDRPVLEPKMIRFCLSHERNICLTARRPLTFRATVRDWVGRFAESSSISLKGQPPGNR